MYMYCTVHVHVQFLGPKFRTPGILPKVIVVHFLEKGLELGGCFFQGRSFAESRVKNLFELVRSLNPVRF